MAEVNNSPFDKTCPAISVIIPVYNSEQYLKKCLDNMYWEGNIFTVRANLRARRFVTKPSAIYHYFARETSTTHSPQLKAKRKADNLTVAREIMTLFESKECSSGERAAVASFCLRHFITRQHLVDPVYYTGLLNILGSELQLASMRRKALRQARRRNLGKFIKKILSLEICQRVNGCLS